MKLQSPAFQNNSEIPRKYTCEGSDISPPLHWENIPPDTKSLALIVDDPDAPDPKAPKRTWVHWLIYNIPARSENLPEGIQSPPSGARFGINDWHREGWGGPCPPKGKHRYFHKLFALDRTLEFPRPPSKAELEEAMRGHILAQSQLVGLYEKTS
ncbi:MAG: YbhB/YbcL family Raf kinase inhibitor-like protein [Bdellovibrionales bacterium]